MNCQQYKIYINQEIQHCSCFRFECHLNLRLSIYKKSSILYMLKRDENRSSDEFSSEIDAPLISFIHPLQSFTPTDYDNIYPYSTKRKIWEFIMYAIAMISLYEIPFEWAFNFAKTKYYVLPAFILDAFFIADLYVLENTGVLVDGIVMSDRRSIRHHIPKWRYILYWVSPWPFYLIGWLIDNDIAYNVCVTLKALRILRAIDANRTITNSIDYYSIGAEIYLLFFQMVFITQLSTCGFWLVGHFEDPDESWLTTSGIGSKSLWSQYFYTFYFASTTVFTIGYGDIHPNTFSEMIFVIIIECVGVFFYNYMVSNIVSFVTGPSRKQFFWNFKNYYLTFERRGLDMNSLHEVSTYFEYLWEKDRNRQAFYEAASKLPTGLQKRIELALHMEVFQKVNSFKNLSEDKLQKLAVLLHPRIFTPGDSLVFSGRVSKRMFFITSGKVSLYNNQGSLLANFDVQSTLLIGETSVVLGRAEQATAIADTYVEAFELLKEDYDQLEEIHPPGLEFFNDNRMLRVPSLYHLAF